MAWTFLVMKFCTTLWPWFDNLIEYLPLNYQKIWGKTQLFITVEQFRNFQSIGVWKDLWCPTPTPPFFSWTALSSFQTMLIFLPNYDSITVHFECKFIH